MTFVNNLSINKEKTFDSMIYIYTLENNAANIAAAGGGG
jgi:hypothetical protein